MRSATTGGPFYGSPISGPSSTTPRSGWPTIYRHRPPHLVLDLDPPQDDFAKVVAGVVKKSGAKGLHMFVPIDDAAPVDDVTAAARCSSTPPAQAGPPSPRRTARGCARALRCRFRSSGPSSTRSPLPTSRSTRRSTRSTAGRRGRSQCRRPSGCRPTLSNMAAPSPSPGWPRCTKESDGPAPGANRRNSRPTVGSTGRRRVRDDPPQQGDALSRLAPTSTTCRPIG